MNSHKNQKYYIGEISKFEQKLQKQNDKQKEKNSSIYIWFSILLLVSLLLVLFINLHEILDYFANKMNVSVNTFIILFLYFMVDFLLCFVLINFSFFNSWDTFFTPLFLAFFSSVIFLSFSNLLVSEAISIESALIVTLTMFFCLRICIYFDAI